MNTLLVDIYYEVYKISSYLYHTKYHFLNSTCLTNSVQSMEIQFSSTLLNRLFNQFVTLNLIFLFNGHNNQLLNSKRSSSIKLGLEILNKLDAMKHSCCIAINN